MKRTIISIAVIFATLLGYAIWEAVYLDQMTDHVDAQMQKIIASSDPAVMQSLCRDTGDYLKKRRWLHNEMINHGEQETLFLTLRKMETYLSQDHTVEAKVCAAEIRQHLEGISQSELIDTFR